MKYYTIIHLSDKNLSTLLRKSGQMIKISYLDTDKDNIQKKPPFI